jgi:hypothetical protein
MTQEKITQEQLKAAHKAFAEHEPRDLFYKAATELVGLIFEGKTKLTLAEALAVLLQTWNKAFYRYTPFDSRHFDEIEGLLDQYRQEIEGFRVRTIESFSTDDKEPVSKIFSDFEEVLGPVGAAKSLHLLAPEFFPLWDRAIAEACRCPLKKRGRNAPSYLRFMEMMQEQISNLGNEAAIDQNPLKILDEYYYCKFTKKWV